MKTYADQPLFIFGPRFVHQTERRARFPLNSAEAWAEEIRKNNPIRWHKPNNNPEDYETVQESFIDWHLEIRKNNP
jgi:hypothetical protein